MGRPSWGCISSPKLVTLGEDVYAHPTGSFFVGMYILPPMGVGIYINWKFTSSSITSIINIGGSLIMRIRPKQKITLGDKKKAVYWLQQYHKINMSWALETFKNSKAMCSKMPLQSELQRCFQKKQTQHIIVLITLDAPSVTLRTAVTMSEQ